MYSYLFHQRKNFSRPGVGRGFRIKYREESPGGGLTFSPTAVVAETAVFQDVKMDPFDAAEIHQPNSRPVGTEQKVARVLVGMNHAQMLKLGFVSLE